MHTVIDTIELLNQYQKPVFSLSELETILPCKREQIPTFIHRLVQKRVLRRISQGWYAVYGKTVVPDEIAPLLYYPSYLSLKTVLSKTGLYNQIPFEIACITYGKSKRITIENTTIVYRQIVRRLYFGYYLHDKIPLAYPEKALLDLLYYVSMGKEHISIEELDLKSINIQRWNSMKNKYPVQMMHLVLKTESQLSFPR